MGRYVVRRLLQMIPVFIGATLLIFLMVNVMGEDFPLDVGAALSDPHVKLHLYGKREPRPHRKMGHLNVLAPTADEALERARAAKAAIAGTAGQPRQA